jgi:hypothetical protein
METQTLTAFTFPRDLYLDRREAKYRFHQGPDHVLMAEAGSPIEMGELRLLFHPYERVEIHRDEEMFDEEVLAFITSFLARKAGSGSTVPHPAETVPPPAPVVKPAVAPPKPAAPAHPAVPPAEPPGKAAALSPPAAGAPPPPAVPRPPPPAKVVARIREDLKEQVFRKIATPEGESDLIAGRLDGQIQDLVQAIGREVNPHQILATPSSVEERTETDVCTDHAMTSQAFGAQLALGETDLFLVAKSAILQTLTEADRKNIQIIKHSLLVGGPRPNYEKRLSQYYEEIAKYLRGRKTDPRVVDLIFESKYIYFAEPIGILPGPSLTLGVTDAFATLREGGTFSIEILEVIPPRLRKLLPSQAASTLKSVEKLLREGCYNEYRKAIEVGCSGGDHCDFFPVSPRSYGLLIFDVSGHARQASDLRDLLVKVISRIPDRSDPARVLNTLNRFIYKYPFPAEVFVSMVYGVIDAAESRFVYANAGHHPPYLVRKHSLTRLEGAGGVPLNMGDEEYANGSVRIEAMDSLVLYTDGLTEAVNDASTAGRKELFGHRRLEAALKSKGIGDLRAQRAVASILAAVRDQGFEIQDDITIQVYRHV